MTSIRYLAKSLVWMYLLTGVGLFVPLLTIPYLARILGPDAWGRVLCAQAIGTLFVVVVEYGFNLTGTRSLAYSMGDRTGYAKIVGSIISAKCVCALIVIALGMLANALMPIFHGHAILLKMAVLWGIIGGMNFGWFLQGTRRAALGLTIDTIARVLGVAATFYLVRGPQHDWVVVALNAAVSLFALLVTFWLVVQEMGWPRLSISGAWSSLKDGGPLASYVLCAGIRNSSSRVLLGFLSSPAVVATFGNAERMTDLIVRSTEPASRVFYPHLCEKVNSSKTDARRTFARAAVLFGSLTAVLSFTTMVFASPIIQLICGPDYMDSVAVLRILAALPILKVAGMLLNTFWAQPHGLDRHMTVGVLFSATVGVVLACIFVERYAALGMAAAVLVSEFVFLCWSMGFLLLHGAFPLPFRRETNERQALREGGGTGASNLDRGMLAVDDSAGR